MSDIAIADHAFLSDSQTSALVTRHGSVDWLCLPRFDSPAVFARLLDHSAGHLSLRPADTDAVPTRRYLAQSLVLETVWTTSAGRLTVRDCLALGADERGHDIGRASPGVLLRHAQCDDGQVEVVVEWAPRPEFGLIHPHLHPVAGGLVSHGGATALVLSTATPMDVDGATARAHVTLATGDDLTLAIQQVDAWSPPPPTWTRARILDAVESTRSAWCSWSELHQTYEGPFQRLVHRSGLVLQGLTYARTGAIVAAATTSLPEGVGTGRNWDYRYSWVRDASMTLRGLWVAACPDEAAGFFAFIARAAASQLDRGVPLQIMFGIGGERDLSERELPHLSGWRDSPPVRVGNGAWAQRQQDIYGAVLDAAHLLRDYLRPLDEVTRELLIASVEAAAATWRVPDQGIWEIRSAPRRYVHSAVMCWVALDRGIALADLLGVTDRLERWRTVRQEISDAILDEGWNDAAGAFTQSFGSPDLDASTLLIAMSGLVPTSDPRLHATIDAVARELTDTRGLVLRYRADDGLGGEEGSFLLCTFWLAEALAVSGRAGEAHDVLRRAAGYANDLGLLSEEVDPQTGELLGNFPQAFSHLGLVLAAQALVDSRREPDERLR